MPHQQTGYAYQAFNLSERYWQGTFAMVRGALRRLFGLQVALLTLLFVGTVVGYWSFDAYLMLSAATLVVYLLGFPWLLYRYRQASRQQANPHTRRGTVLVTPPELIKLLPGSGRIELAQGITIPVEWETQHVIVTGASGTGKTTLFRKIFAQVRNLRGVVHGGKDGEVCSQFFDPQKDLIFSPLDARSIRINLLDPSLVSSDAHFDALARSFVPPDATRENFFNNAARDLLSGILRFCYLENLRSNDAIWQVLKMPTPEIHARLRAIGSEAASYIESSTPQTQSCISTLLQCARCLKYFRNPDHQPWFPLAEWLADPKKPGFIFLNTLTRQREAMLRVMAVFIDILCQLNLSLPDDPNRRFFYLLDEWASLPAMDAMVSLMSQGRSKGAVMMLYFQDIGQAISAYGQHRTQTIVNQASTYIIFRANDTHSAEHWSHVLGQAESEFTDASFSAGQRQDSESYHNVRQKDFLIMPSEIQNLPSLQAFIKMQNLPVTLGKLEYVDYPRKAPGFVPSRAFNLEEESRGVRPDATASTQHADRASTRIKEPKKPSVHKDFSIDDFDF